MMHAQNAPIARRTPRAAASNARARRLPAPLAFARLATGRRVPMVTPVIATLVLGVALCVSPESQAQSAAGSPARPDPGRSGPEVYAAVCSTCHDSGLNKAPRLGDAKAWKPLIAEGQKALVRTAIKGIRQMPPRGGNPSLSDREVERAVVHMANAAGGRFKEPR